MIISALKSNDSRDSRSPIHPETVSALTTLGAEILFEKDIGFGIYTSNEDFIAKGLQQAFRADCIQKSDMVISLQPLSEDEIKSMKKVSGTLKLDQAQFRELEAFAKFGSDLDAATLNVIEKGKRNVEILKQAQNDPFTVEEQTAIIYAGSKNLLRSVPVESVKEFEQNYLETLRNKHKKTLEELKAGKLTDAVLDTLNAVAKETSAQFE
mgnify:CR=1 FL=1